MSGLLHTVARRIDSFVENPFTKLVKGLVIFSIGLSDVSHSYRDDVTHGHVRIGHGLIIIGLFSVLGSLPHLLDGIAAWARFVDRTEEKSPPREQEQRS